MFFLDKQEVADGENVVISSSDLDFILSRTRDNYIKHLKDSGQFGDDLPKRDLHLIERPLGKTQVQPVYT